ncbi:structural maintenance of chromosomes flexible hinge domain-containing protein 1-like isoform X2 [Lineus longissimus]|uniref:structural maintenance of chromosomes flexible hinge domain-containing protein 1-like isoform X2 n=1 Tax=Lineus longissimus TaxID=88925 RepID=UPI00315CC0E0
MYEYYASEGQNPLPYAFAELIDNSLAATADNLGVRQIEIRLHFDDTNPSKNVMVVLDNGKGMAPKQLNNWAIYRLSKFIRKDKKRKFSAAEDGGAGNDDDDDNRPSTPGTAPRSLNSDISYFGVGGKQAVFFIGTSTRMISKPRDSRDVHELTISKEEFERKEKNKEAIYSGFIRNRKPGDTSHLKDEDEVVRHLIEEEKDKDHFTAVVINGINQTHIPYMKTQAKSWARQLAHIYHYYIHGPHGNMDKPDETRRPGSPFKNIDIEIKIFNKGHTTPKVISLRDISDDMQTQYIRSAVCNFDFKATVEGTGVVEGVLRYHPFMYDRETYPSDAIDPRAEAFPEDDSDVNYSDIRPARGRRAIYECYWNGRLIPYTTIDDFEWCSIPKKARGNIPLECFNRISGVLFTNDKFQVSTNKLTFIDLEMKLRDKQCVFSRVIQGPRPQEKRTNIDKEFYNWLKECHEQCDKQIKFSHFTKQVSRNDLPKNKQTPWAEYTHIEWDGKAFQKGQLVRIQRTLPVTYGRINRFLLFGDHEGDVFATGGDIEIVQEPKTLYDEVKVYPLVKLDRTVTQEAIKKYIEEEEAKLPHKLKIAWPEGYEVTKGEKRAAGKTVGAIKVEIANRKGEYISKLPGTVGSSKKLLVELKVIWHSPHGDEVIVSHISQHGKTWPYWFRKMENIKNLGQYTISIQAVLNESGANKFAGRELPMEKIKFTVTEAEPEKFNVGLLEGPFRVGSPFQIPLEFQDGYNNLTKPSEKLEPKLEASGLELKYDQTEIKGNTLVIKGIIAKGAVSSVTGQNFDLTVSVEALENSKQSLKIRLLPGPPQSIRVQPTEEPIEIENGQPANFTVCLLDEAGNVTTVPKVVLTAKFTGVPGLAHYLYTGDCTSTGHIVFTGEPLVMKKVRGSQNLTAKIEVQGMRNIKAVERKLVIVPSSKASNMEVFYKYNGDKNLPIRAGSDINGVAGEMIKGITFKIFDEAGREIEMEDHLAKKVKVNWTPKLIKDLVLKGGLPDIKIPTSASDTKYCHISINGTGVDFSFTIKPTPGEPAVLKCKCASTQMRIGETLDGEIVITLKDKKDNEIKNLPSSAIDDLEVSGDDLNIHEIDKSINGNTFVIKGVKFEGNSLGGKELKIKWKELTEYVRLQMVSGPPAKLTIPGWDLTQAVAVFNERKFEKPLIVQVCDELGNPTSDPEVKVQLAKDTGIKLSPAPQPTKVDKAGQVNFGNLIVTAKTGSYEIQPKALYGKVALSGPKLKISVTPDAAKPVSIKLQYDKNAVYVVGFSMPSYTVEVIAEDDTLMTAAQPSYLTMRLWRADNINPKPPDSGSGSKLAISYSPDPRKETDKDGIFVFSNKKVPELAGMHSVVFIYNDGKHEVLSNQVAINVSPGSPAKLVPVYPPGTLTVSNTSKAGARSLIKSVKFELRDKYENKTGHNINGVMAMEIMSTDGTTHEVPNFVGQTRRKETPMSQGQAMAANLTIEEDSPGKDGVQYILRVSILSQKLEQFKIPHYDIPFLFYNDARKQTQMSALTKERDNLKQNIKAYESLFETTQMLIKELQILVNEATKEEKRIKDELKKQKIPESQINNKKNLERLIDHRIKERDELINRPRRVCTVPLAPKENEVLGKVCHLAQAEDEDSARVLSWHMSADMDCVVTHTLKKAKDIYSKSGGKQQVLPLESIYRKTLPDWNKPLPHVRFRPNWKPQGNPMYARNLLIFPHDPDNCKLVFGMLLGDTIILDNLDHANAYRHEIVRFTHCPTILTRTGDRIRSNGKFGGLMNKALPIERLRGMVFGAPLPMAYHAVCTQIDVLQSYREALVKREKATNDLQEQLNNQKTVEMKTKNREYNDAKSQLGQIESRLGMCKQPEQDKQESMDTNENENNAKDINKSRGRRSAAADDGPSAKKSRQASPAVNGSPAQGTRRPKRNIQSPRKF